MSAIKIQNITPHYYEWILKVLTSHWGSSIIISRGKTYDATTLPGFVAILNNEPVGLCTFHINKDQLEIISLNSMRENLGVGSALIVEIINEAKRRKCKRVWLITTNDNLNALGFYQKRRFVLARVHTNSIIRSRQLKPEIPLIGQNGIPIRDELELEIIL